VARGGVAPPTRVSEPVGLRNLLTELTLLAISFGGRCTFFKIEGGRS